MVDSAPSLPAFPATLPLSASLAELVAWVVFLLGLLTLVAVGFWGRQVYRDRIAKVAALERAAEEAFEREALSEFRPPAPAPPDAPPEPASAAPSGPAPAPAAPAPAASTPVPAADGGDPLAAFVQRLQGLGVAAYQEGSVPLAIPPAAPIVRLRTGGLAVVLPRMESDAVVEHMARRFDLVFVLAPGGKALVVERFDTRGPQLADRPAAPSLPPRTTAGS